MTDRLIAPRLDTLAHVDPVACRALWIAVLAEALRQALAPGRGDDKLAVQQAQNWFGTQDFWQVCALGGVDGAAVHAAYEAARASGRKISKWEMRAVI